jgi:hypothetical protein
MTEKEGQPIAHSERKSDDEPSTTIRLEHLDEEQHEQHHSGGYDPERPDQENEQANNTNNSSTMNTTDDEILLEDGLPASVPLSSLAGPALVMSPDFLMSGEEGALDDEPKKRENFDWAGRDEEEEDETKKGKPISQSSLFICLSKNSSYIAWTCIILFALILIAVDVAIFEIYKGQDAINDTSKIPYDPMVPYNLKVWFTFLAFMWCIGFLSQVAVELVPWAIKKLFGYLRPQSTEVLRMRLSVSCQKVE